jgi:serine/threonine protein kinase
VTPSSTLEARFLREALITARLQHPSIVPVYQAGRWPTGEPFYAMKLLSGDSFKGVVEQRRSLEQRLGLLPHMIAVAEAIAYAHSEGFIHRDLKPSNVLIGRFGETLVVDWGLAKELKVSSHPTDTSLEELPRRDGDQTLQGTVLGTPAYMPPEQAQAAIVDERADVYALGALIYFMLAGVPPYSGDSAAEIVSQVLAGPPPPLARRQPDAPSDLQAIVQKAMARQPDQRYRHAGELAEDLKRFQTGQLVGAHQYSSLSLIKRWLGRNRALVLTAGLLLAALAATATLR